jgi:cytoskeletal protein CcmA (bactofilin family)
MSCRLLRNERGIALISVLLVTLALVAVAAGALLLSSHNSLVNKYHVRQSMIETAADAGLEEARSKVNGTKALYPDTGYNTLEYDAPVYDAGGNVIPGLKRSLYVGPVGISSGQYGVFGSAVSLVRDQSGNQVVRRLEIVQESFAKFAYFTDIEGSITFGSGDQIFGPVHSNDQLEVNSTGATFHGPVSTAQNIVGKSYATFKQGYQEHVSPIAMPTTTDLVKLRTQALAGNTAFTSNNNGDEGQAEMRIEFVAIDLDGDGFVNGPNEGFFKVYTSTDETWVSATRPNNSSTTLHMRSEDNCGHLHGTTFVDAATHVLEPSADSWSDALTSATRRCYLGGDSVLTNSFVASNAKGQWLLWPGAVSPLLVGRPDAAYLFPINRELNPTFKGVIYVDGKVVISGTLRGRVTLAATNNIIIGDDLTYVTNPAAGTCNDILGLFSATDVVISDNLINTPARVIHYNSGTFYTFDNTKDEFFHGVVLALSNFTVQRYNSGVDAGDTGRENCETINRGRGCLYLTGGIIQYTRGGVGTTTSGTSGGTGNVKRYSYDACAFSNPPPYFPTTGRFAKGHYFEVDPTGFNIATYFGMLQAGS